MQIWCYLSGGCYSVRFFFTHGILHSALVIIRKLMNDFIICKYFYLQSFANR